MIMLYCINYELNSNNHYAIWKGTFFQKKTLYIVHNQVIPFFLIENDLLIY